jgi:hypothetical protein
MVLDLIADAQERGGVAGDARILGDYQSDRLTAIGDPVIMERPKGRAWWRYDVSMLEIEPSRVKSIGMGEDFQDARNRKRLGCFNRHHSTLRNRT